jgi:hypothetical protein
MIGLRWRLPRNHPGGSTNTTRFQGRFGTSGDYERDLARHCLTLWDPRGMDSTNNKIHDTHTLVSPALGCVVDWEKTTDEPTINRLGGRQPTNWRSNRRSTDLDCIENRLWGVHLKLWTSLDLHYSCYLQMYLSVTVSWFETFTNKTKKTKQDNVDKTLSKKNQVKSFCFSDFLLVCDLPPHHLQEFVT